MLLNGILDDVNYQDGKRTRLRAEERLIETVKLGDYGRNTLGDFNQITTFWKILNDWGQSRIQMVYLCLHICEGHHEKTQMVRHGEEYIMRQYISERRY